MTTERQAMREPLLSILQSPVLLGGILLIVIHSRSAVEGRHSAAKAAEEVAPALADYRAGNLDDLLSFQTNCGTADGLRYLAPGITVLFMEHTFTTAKREAKRTNPFSPFETPTFSQSRRMVDPASTLAALRCKP